MPQPVILKKADVERFYEDLQDFLELTPQKDVVFLIGDWNANVRSSSKSLQEINAGEGVEKREPLYIGGRTVTWYSHYENSMEVP